MAPIHVKPALARSSAQSVSSSAQDARLLVWETIRISASLASSGPPSTSATPPLSVQPLEVDQSSKNVGVRLRGLIDDEFVSSSFRLICCEEVDGHRWKYLDVTEDGAGSSLKLKNKGSIRAVGLHTPLNPLDELISFVTSGSNSRSVWQSELIHFVLVFILIGCLCEYKWWL